MLRVSSSYHLKGVWFLNHAMPMGQGFCMRLDIIGNYIMPEGLLHLRTCRETTLFFSLLQVSWFSFGGVPPSLSWHLFASFSRWTRSCLSFCVLCFSFGCVWTCENRTQNMHPLAHHACEHPWPKPSGPLSWHFATLKKVSSSCCIASDTNIDWHLLIATWYRQSSSDEKLSDKCAGIFWHQFCYGILLQHPLSPPQLGICSLYLTGQEHYNIDAAALVRLNFVVAFSCGMSTIEAP